jgi:hypothetical protein
MDFETKQDSEVGTFLVHGPESLMRGIFGNIIEEVPKKLASIAKKQLSCGQTPDLQNFYVIPMKILHPYYLFSIYLGQ